MPDSRVRPPSPPWPLYPAGLILLTVCVAASIFLLQRESQLWALDRPFVGARACFVAVLLAAGQVCFYYARRLERRFWELRRAPQLAIAEADPDDVVWLRGRVACEAPLTIPYSDALQCVYYSLTVSQRGGKGRIVRQETRSANFRLQDESGSISIPFYLPDFDAPSCLNADIDRWQHVNAAAILVDSEVSVCGRVTGDRQERLLDHPGKQIRAVVTDDRPDAYLATISEDKRFLYAGGWGASIAAVGLLVANAFGVI